MDPAHVVRRLRAVPAHTASLRTERKGISREIAGLDRVALLGLAHYLIEARIPRFVAYELVLNHQPAMSLLTPPEVERLGAGMKRWGDVDSFACFIAGHAWRTRRIPDSLVRTWTRSADWCWRRAALVSTVPLNSRAQGGTGDARRTLAICRLLLGDREDMVVKAMSWALRELAKRDPGSVRGFLAAHRGQLAPRVIREVTNKLITGLKNPRRL
ncbi:MAG TPA: DNA alkylation repair protein [Bryobacteraceae bacterium]|nr:DNA alkylation repair protein [Bryobacteraceae bacterium]